MDRIEIRHGSRGSQSEGQDTQDPKGDESREIETEMLQSEQRQGKRRLEGISFLEL